MSELMDLVLVENEVSTAPDLLARNTQLEEQVERLQKEIRILQYSLRIAAEALQEAFK